jgi:hypothetical protein
MTGTGLGFGTKRPRRRLSRVSVDGNLDSHQHTGQP